MDPHEPVDPLGRLTARCSTFLIAQTGGFAAYYFFVEPTTEGKRAFGAAFAAVVVLGLGALLTHRTRASHGRGIVLLTVVAFAIQLAAWLDVVAFVGSPWWRAGVGGLVLGGAAIALSAVWPTAAELSSAAQAINPGDGVAICTVECEQQPDGTWTGQLTVTRTDGSPQVVRLMVPPGLDLAGVDHWMLNALPDGDVSFNRTDGGKRRIAVFERRANQDTTEPPQHSDR